MGRSTDGPQDSPRTSSHLQAAPAPSTPSLRTQALRVLDRRLVRRFGLLSVASVLAAGLDAVGIVLLVPLIERLSGGEGASVASDLPLVGDLSTGWLLLLVVGFFTAKSVTMALIRWWSVGVVLDASATTATRLFGAYLHAPLSFHDQHNTSTSVRNLSGSVQQFFQNGVLYAASGIAESATLLVLAAIVLVSAPLPALIGVIYFSAASLFYVKVLQARTRRDATIAQEKAATVIRILQEGMGGLREHRLRASEPDLINTFRVDRTAQARAQRFVTFAGELSRFYLEILVMGGFGLVAGVTVATSDGNTEGLTALAVLLAVAFRMLPSLSRLLAASTNLKVGRAALDTITADLDALGIDTLTDPGAEPRPAHTPRGSPGRLELKDVGFRYAGAPENALQQVSVSVEAGSSLGVVGPSGAGKSTLIDVVCGLRLPTSGSVEVDGHSIEDDPARWRREIGLVPQDVFLVDATIAENVAFGLPLREGLLWDALRRAQLDAFVRSLPAGPATQVGERGTRLSGGQRQRLGIARALYAQPSILVLDEATAALDVETEAAVVESVAALEGELTLIVVAHRLSTIRRCDRIAYLEAGRIRHIGSFEETAAEVPDFARAVALAGLNSGDRESDANV